MYKKNKNHLYIYIIVFIVIIVALLFFIFKDKLLIKNDNKKEKMLNILVDEDNLTINLKFENSEDLHRFLKKINK